MFSSDYCFQILPSLEGKNGASLLKELTNMWANYKLMSKCLGGFFLYLDRPYKTSTSLSDVSIRCFRNLVKMFPMFAFVLPTRNSSFLSIFLSLSCFSKYVCCFRFAMHTTKGFRMLQFHLYVELTFYFCPPCSCCI